MIWSPRFLLRPRDWIPRNNLSQDPLAAAGKETRQTSGRERDQRQDVVPKAALQSSLTPPWPGHHPLSLCLDSPGGLSTREVTVPIADLFPGAPPLSLLHWDLFST
ncbi:hypothetical protein H1C71_028557 [Ictidomys tridecemlineatus]|nr:hypothetical protein H1C71_028557 [Ictidomys tridecemlineatus]